MNLRRLSAIAVFTGMILSPGIIFREQIFSSAENPAPAVQHERFENEGLEALEALQFISKARAYPNADIPNDAYAKAWEQHNARFANEQTAATGNWTSMGPNNVGGRTLCIAIHPSDTNTIWLGSASGGLWKSTTGGIGVNAWTYVTIGFPVLGVSTIAINPQNPNEMYIGTGETYNYGMPLNGLTDRTTRGTVGMGIFKTTDGGVTWSQCLNWTYQQQRGIWEIIINPLRPQTVFAATTEGIYKSTDSGNNWTPVLNVTMCMDIAMHNPDTTVLLCGVGNLNSANKGLYRSVNGGLNWSVVSNGFPNVPHTGRIQVSMFAGNNDIAIAEMSDMFNTIGFYKTTDKGVTWTSLSSLDVTGYQGWYAEGLLIKPDDLNTVLAGGIDVFRSADGGATFGAVSQWWNYLPHADVHEIVANPQNPSSVFFITDGGLYRSYDFGDSYFDCNDGYVTSQAYIGSVSRTDPNYGYTGLQDNNTYMYSGSPYWNAVVGGDGSYNAIDPVDDNTAYASYQYLNVFQSYDHGLSFFQVISTPSSASGGNPAAFLAPFVIAPNNNFRLYAGGTAIFRSDDQGVSFNQVSPDPVETNSNVVLAIAVSETNEDSLYITTAPDLGPMKVMLSADGGLSFADRSSGLPNRFPRRITVDPRDSRIAYVVFAGFGTGHIYKTLNAGITWTDMSASLPDVPFHCITVDPLYPDIVYAGSDIGLYVSTDGGATWMAHNTGLHDWTMVFDLVVSYSDRMLHAHTHGHGVWKRSLDDVTGIAHSSSVSFSASVYPNPANEFTNVIVHGTSGETKISVFDLGGKLIAEKEIAAGVSETTVRFATGDWAEGCYVVKVESGRNVSTGRIIVKH
jgi:hypothetical protein